MPSPSLKRSGRSRPSPPSSVPGAKGRHPLDEVIAEIARLQKMVLKQLTSRRESLRRELASIDAELAEFAAEPAAEEKAPSAPPPSTAKRNTSLPELIAVLGAAPGKTVNIRKAALDLASVKALAKTYPQLLKLGGKGASAMVTLLERAEQKLERGEQKPSNLKTQGPQEDLFA